MTDLFGLPADGLRAAALVALAAFFVFTGVVHFARPRLFTAIVPPGLPAPGVLVAGSGAAEVLGGIGLLVPGARVAAAWGLLALLLAVFPANVFMARHADRFRRIAPPWALWARLPLQPVLMAVVAWAAGLVG
ncbi:MAG TPA: hypothetical protein VGB53_15565 [Rubricoccaceae bacterium]